MADVERRWGPAAETQGGGRSDLAAARERQGVIIGDPAPLGLVAFGTSAFVAGTVLAGWWPAPVLQLLAIAPLLMIFGGIVQFIAAMWSFGRGQTSLATFLGAFGAFFGIAGIYELTIARAAAAAAASPAAGLAASLLGPLAVAVACFAFIALLVAVSSAFTSLGLSATAGALGLGLALLAWALFAQGNTVLQALSGWLGIISAVLAFLTAAAMGVAGGVGRLAALGDRWLRPARGRA